MASKGSARRPVRGESLHDVRGVRGLLAGKIELLREDACDRGALRWRYAGTDSAAGETDV